MKIKRIIQKIALPFLRIVVIIGVVLFMIEQIIFLRYVSKKLEINYSIRDGFDVKKMKKICSKIESFQKIGLPILTKRRRLILLIN